MFYSGYGILESFKKKGNKYIKTLPIKSFIFLIKTEIIIFIFLCNNLLLGIKINLVQYLQAIILRKSIGNSYWFCFTIISLYIYSFFAFFFVKKGIFSIFGILLITIICFLHIYLVYNYYHPKSIISVDTIICFVLGFHYSFFKSFIDLIIQKNDLIKIRIKNNFLLLLNNHSYSIYLLQRVIMKYVKIKDLFRNNEFIKFFFEFITVNN